MGNRCLGISSVLQEALEKDAKTEQVKTIGLRLRSVGCSGLCSGRICPGFSRIRSRIWPGAGKAGGIRREYKRTETDCERSGER